MISMFSEAMQRRFGAVGIHLAVSPVSRGKSNCAKVAVAVAGNYPKGVVTLLTDSRARTYLSGSLPFVYDDPTCDTVLKPLLMNSFGGAEMSTQRQQFSARCSPLVTANVSVVEELVKADRRYNHLSLYNSRNTLTCYFDIQVCCKSTFGSLCLPSSKGIHRCIGFHPKRSPCSIATG